MKKLILLVMAVLLPLAMLYAADEQQQKIDDAMNPPAATSGDNNGSMILGGGPDGFGYRWKDSNDAGGPVFNWIDITTDGVEITPWPHGNVDDGYTDPIDMGMTFTYYGIDYTSVVVSTNGWVSFLTQTSSYLGNSSIPTAGNPNALLAPYWDDQDGGTVGHCYYYSDAANNRFIVSWVNWPYYPDPTDPHNFQIIINANDSTIVNQYGAGTFSQSDVTIGIENEAGTIGLQVTYNQFYAANNLATKFFWTSPLAHDVGVNAILTPGGSTYKDSTYTVTSRVKNLGANTETNVPVSFVIRDTTGAIVYNQSTTVPSLMPESVAVATFPNWIPGQLFTHTMKSFTTLGTDLDRSNDTSRATTYTFGFHGSGGPVDYWTYADQNNGGEAFNWIEIANPEDTVHFSSRDDGYSGMHDMGMDFQFFGQTYSRISIVTNGWMSFTDSTSTALGNTALPNTGTPNATVALLWDDLYVPTTGFVYRHYDPVNNLFIVEYDSVEFYTSGGPDCIKMEAIFNGNTNTIKMQYQMFCDSSQSDVTIGIENETGTIGLAYDNNGEVLQKPYNELAITWRFTAPAHDLMAENFTAPPPSGIVNVPVTPQVQFRNMGASDETNVPVHLTIDPGGYTNNQTISRIDSGSTASVSFANFTPTVGGIYTLTASINLSSDIDHSNDTVRTTYTVYDTLINFEVNNAGLMPTGNWQYGIPTSGPNGAYSGENCWATVLDGNYTAGLSTLTFNLNVGTTNPSLSVAGWYDTESNYDGGNFAVSTDGVTWLPISPTRGYDAASNSSCPLYPDSIFSGHTHQSWQTVTFPLADYSGQSVLARFAFGASATTFYAGWYIDDLGLSDCDIVFPNISYGPNSITGNAAPGSSTTAPLTISNNGAGPLFFSARAVQDYQPAPNSVPASPIGYRTVADKNGNNISEPYYPPVIASQGGPDAFGNYWVDSDEPNGPVYGWIDITDRGAEIPLSSDDQTLGPFDIGFDFSFYGNTFTQFYACSNGWVSFTDGTHAYYGNLSLPNTGSAPFDLLAPFWDDLTFSTAGDCWFYSDGNQLVISYIAVPHLGSGGPYTFQIILNSNGTFLFQYDVMTARINECTIGIQNGDGTDGLQVVYNADYLHDSMAIRFTQPVHWLSIDTHSGSINPGGDPVVITVNMNATELPEGTYTGNIYVNSNDPDQSAVTVPVTFTVTGGSGGNCDYTPGDINGNGNPNGIDVVFGVNYFKGIGVPPVDCHPICTAQPDPFYAAGDVNGNCTFNGIDITYFVRYLKGQVPNLLYCPNCPPAPLAAPGVVKPAIMQNNIQKANSQE